MIPFSRQTAEKCNQRRRPEIEHVNFWNWQHFVCDGLHVLTLNTSTPQCRRWLIFCHMCVRRYFWMHFHKIRFAYSESIQFSMKIVSNNDDNSALAQVMAWFWKKKFNQTLFPIHPLESNGGNGQQVSNSKLWCLFWYTIRWFVDWTLVKIWYLKYRKSHWRNLTIGKSSDLHNRIFSICYTASPNPKDNRSSSSCWYSGSKFEPWQILFTCKRTSLKALHHNLWGVIYQIIGIINSSLAIEIKIHHFLKIRYWKCTSGTNVLI